MKNKFRIVTDRYAGYEVQTKKWWFPFWIMAGGTNTHPSLESAQRYAEKVMNRVVYTYDSKEVK